MVKRRMDPPVKPEGDEGKEGLDIYDIPGSDKTRCHPGKALALSGAYSDVISALWIPDQVRDDTLECFVFLVTLRLPTPSFSDRFGGSIVKRRMDPPVKPEGDEGKRGLDYPNKLAPAKAGIGQ